jgi:hypothetical protein
MGVDITDSHFLGFFVIGIIITGSLTFLITRGVWGIRPRLNRFDQPAHTVSILQQSLLFRTLIATALVFLVLVVGIWLVVRSSMLYSQDPSGSGGIPSHEMPYTIVMNLRLRIEDTLYHPTQPLDDQTKNALIKLDTALAAYQNRYINQTYREWELTQSLLTYMEETEGKLPELNRNLPEYKPAKDSLISYVESNSPHIIEEETLIPYRLPSHYYSLVWLKQPVWSWLLVLILSVICLSYFAIFIARRRVQNVITTTQGAEARTAYKHALKTAITNQLRTHPTNPYHNIFDFTRCDPRPNNNGYFVTVQCLDRMFNQAIQENERRIDRPVKCLIFTIDQNGQIEVPIFEASILYQGENTQVRQAISSSTRANLRQNLAYKLNNQELNNLCIDMEIPNLTTNNLQHEQRVIALIDLLLQQGQICKLIEHLQKIRPQENWLTP